MAGLVEGILPYSAGEDADIPGNFSSVLGIIVYNARHSPILYSHIVIISLAFLLIAGILYFIFTVSLIIIHHLRAEKEQNHLPKFVVDNYKSAEENFSSFDDEESYALYTAAKKSRLERKMKTEKKKSRASSKKKKNN